MNKGKPKDEYIIIVGCGRLGSHIANLFSKKKKSVVVIDKESNAFRRLGVDFSGFTIEADAIEEDVLIEAKIDQADILIAVTDDDNANIMVAQIAKIIFNVPKVIARIFDVTMKKLYEGLDINIISPTILSAKKFIDIVEEGAEE
ncbi:MAG: NAD-binding protein [Candidatus Humimicrobiaceae bacterium]